MPSSPVPPPEPSSEPTAPSEPSLPPVVTGQGPDTLVLPPNVAAGLAVLTFGLAGIAFLVLEKRNLFVRFWAMQSVFFGVALTAYAVVSFVVVHVLFFLLWLLAFPLFALFWLVKLGILLLWLVMLFQAFSGKEWELPILGKMARAQLAKLPPG